MPAVERIRTSLSEQTNNAGARTPRSGIVDCVGLSSEIGPADEVALRELPARAA